MRYEMTGSAGDFTREQLHATGWTDEQLIERGHMREVEPERFGLLVVKTRGADGLSNSVMQRTSINPSADCTLIYKALEFRDAAARDGRVFVCALVPRWKGRILALLGVK